MSASFTWTGLEEEYRDLASLPTDLTTDAQTLAHQKALAVASAIVNAYPSRTGGLRREVRVTMEPGGRYGAGARVISGARHARVFEVGSHGARSTLRGWNRGRMPASPTFIPRMQQARAQYYADLREILRRWGLEPRDA